MKILKNKIFISTFFFALFILIFGCASSYRKATLEDKAPYQEIREIEGKKDELFLRTRRWMAETFNSSKAVIELEDKEKGQIIGNTRLLIKGGLGTTIYFDMTTIFDIKDGKIRLTAKNFRENLPGYPDFKTTNAFQWQELKRKIALMFDDLINYIKKDRKNEMWE
jgi:hypothetical protein